MTYLNYCGGGTVWDLNTTREGALRDLKMLRDGGWLIADDVRALITEFVLYNPGTSLFALFRGLVEFHPAGTVVPTFNIVAVRSPERCLLVRILLCPSRPQKGAGTALVRGRETGSTSKREDFEDRVRAALEIAGVVLLKRVAFSIARRWTSRGRTEPGTTTASGRSKKSWRAWKSSCTCKSFATWFWRFGRVDEWGSGNIDGTSGTSSRRSIY